MFPKDGSILPFQEAEWLISGYQQIAKYYPHLKKTRSHLCGGSLYPQKSLLIPQ